MKRPECMKLRIVVTGFDCVRVNDSTWNWFLTYHASPRIKPATVEQRAIASIEAIACFLSERAWIKGERLKEI